MVSASAQDSAATVLMSALTQWPILHALIKKTPGDLTRATFVSAWVDTAASILQHDFAVGVPILDEATQPQSGPST